MLAQPPQILSSLSAIETLIPYMALTPMSTGVFGLDGWFSGPAYAPHTISMGAASPPLRSALFESSTVGCILKR
jgi:hypothetical protein